MTLEEGKALRARLAKAFATVARWRAQGYGPEPSKENVLKAMEICMDDVLLDAMERKAKRDRKILGGAA